MKTTVKLAAGLALLAGLAAAPAANAQSTEEVLGTVIGGTAGAIIGKEIDGGRNTTEGQLIGAAIGGTLGYVIGDSIDDKNDDKRRYRQYQARQGYYGYPQRPVYRDSRYYGYQQPAYGYRTYAPRRGHPVHAHHPGRGYAHGHYKKRRGW